MTLAKELLYQANTVISLYDGDDDPSDADLAGAAADAAADLAAGRRAAGGGDGSGGGNESGKNAGANPDSPLNADPDARFNTDQVNKIVQERLAKERKRQSEENTKLQKKLEEVLANQSLTEEERSDLQQTIEDMRKQNRTKEEEAKHQRRQLQEEYEKRLKESVEKAAYWENEYRSQTINRSLMDAAVKHDAFLPTQVVTILKEYTKLVQPRDENGKPIEGAGLEPLVDLPDVDAEDGKAIITQRSPEDAVSRLKELQPNLFKANVVSGVGGNSSTGGVAPGQDGSVDLSKLSTAQFMELYKKDPSLVGVKKRRSF